jgi:hypothetical protein
MKSAAAVAIDEASIRGFKAFLFGWLLPSLLFVAGAGGEIWISATAHTSKSYGPFAGAMYAPLLVLVVMIMNAWVFLRRWRTIVGIFRAAIVLPVFFLIGLGAILFLG